MRLLPRTPRTTWLLAAAGWAAVGAAVWWALPVRPRAEWALPEPGGPACFLPGRVLVTAAHVADRRHVDFSGGPLRLWDADTGRLLHTIKLPPNCRFEGLRPSRTGRWLAVFGFGVDGRPLWLIDLTDGRATTAPGDPLLGLTDCAFGPDDRWLLCAADRSAVRLTLPAMTSDRPPILARTPPAPPVALAPDGMAAAVWDGEDQALRVWRAEPASPLSIPLPPDWVTWGLDLSDDGAVLSAYHVASVKSGAGQQHAVEVRCWETATGRELFRAVGAPLPALVGLPFNVGRRGVALSRDGRTLAALCGSADDPGAYQVALWDVAGGTVRALLDVPADALGEGFAGELLSPDGRTAVLSVRWPPAWARVRHWVERAGLRWPFVQSASEPGAALFDVATGRYVGRVTGVLRDAAWAPDGSLLATPDESGRLVRVWDVPPRKPLAWFVPLAALLALPPAWLARRRARALRRPEG